MKHPRIFSAFYSLPWAVAPQDHKAWGVLLNRHVSGMVPVTERGSNATARAIGPAASGIPGVGIINVSGIIGKHLSNMELDCSDGCCLTLVNAAIDNALAAGLDTVIFDFDTPGGTCVGVPETAAKIRSLSDAGIKTYAWTESQCCSAGYWLASACDEIHASPSAIVGSIGVYCALVDDTRAWENEGIAFEYFSSDNAPLKGAGAPGRGISDASRNEAAQSVADWTELFHSQVTSRRKVDASKAFTGGAWPAMKAPAGITDSADVATLSDFLSLIQIDRKQ